MPRELRARRRELVESREWDSIADKIVRLSSSEHRSRIELFRGELGATQVYQVTASGVLDLNGTGEAIEGIPTMTRRVIKTRIERTAIDSMADKPERYSTSHNTYEHALFEVELLPATPEKIQSFFAPLVAEQEAAFDVELAELRANARDYLISHAATFAASRWYDSLCAEWIAGGVFTELECKQFFPVPAPAPTIADEEHGETTPTWRRAPTQHGFGPDVKNNPFAAALGQSTMR